MVVYQSTVTWRITTVPLSEDTDTGPSGCCVHPELREPSCALHVVSRVQSGAVFKRWHVKDLRRGSNPKTKG